MTDVREIQQRLAEAGFNPGIIDGIIGPLTEAAIICFKKYYHLEPVNPHIGSEFIRKLYSMTSSCNLSIAVPWVNEITQHMGLDEIRDNGILKQWLISDGKTLGDPAQFPWCGDAVQTALRLTMPNEMFVGRVASNPYLARNWLEFGRKVDMVYGAVCVLWRGKRNGISGHVGFVVGYDPARKRIRLRGGNQHNSISDTWVRESRVLGYRVPHTFTDKLPPVPLMDSTGSILSTNED